MFMYFRCTCRNKTDVYMVLYRVLDIERTITSALWNCREKNSVLWKDTFTKAMIPIDLYYYESKSLLTHFQRIGTRDIRENQMKLKFHAYYHALSNILCHPFQNVFFSKGRVRLQKAFHHLIFFVGWQHFQCWFNTKLQYAVPNSFQR